MNFGGNDSSLPTVKSSDKGKEKTRKSISKFHDYDASSTSSISSKESNIHTMGPLMQDFMFLERIALNPDIVKDMLGKRYYYIYKYYYFD